MHRCFCALILVVTLNAARLGAQESVGVKQVAHREVATTSLWLPTLRIAAAQGDTDHLLTTAKEFLQDIGTATSGQGYNCCDFKTNYYLLIFTSTDQAGKPTLAHVLVHDPPLENSSLPGLKGPNHMLFEVFVAEDMSVNIQGSVDVERTENPATKQLGDFVTTVVGKLTVPSSINTFHVMNVAPVPPEKRQFKQSITFSTIEFPYARAKLTGKHVVTVADPILHLKAVVQSTAAQLEEEGHAKALKTIVPATSTNESSPPQSPTTAKRKPSTPVQAQNYGINPAQVVEVQKLEVRCDDLISAISKLLLTDLDSDACMLGVTDQSDCFKKLKTDLGSSLKKDKFVPDSKCSADEARAVVTTFVPIIADSPRVSASTTLTNQPPQRFSFGLATGYIAGIETHSDSPRVQIQSGKIAANPFTRSLTMGVVNLPVWGYNPSTFEPDWREKIRPFVGLPFAPYFGLSGGGSYLLTRTIAVNVGYARLWYDTPGPHEQVDQAPVNKENPFRLASTNSWFVAAGYNFGK